MTFPSKRMVRSAPFALLAVMAGLAQAAEPVALKSRDGLLVLPNVTVTMATPAQRDQAPLAVSSKARAFMDSESGQLRMPTIEEQQAIAAEPEEATGPVAVQRLANGSLVARPGAAAMSYSVARREASGKLDTACVTGPTAAAKAMTGSVSHKGHDHGTH